MEGGRETNRGLVTKICPRPHGAIPHLDAAQECGGILLDGDAVAV